MIPLYIIKRKIHFHVINGDEKKLINVKIIFLLKGYLWNIFFWIHVGAENK